MFIPCADSKPHSSSIHAEYICTRTRNITHMRNITHTHTHKPYCEESTVLPFSIDFYLDRYRPFSDYLRTIISLKHKRPLALPVY